MTPDEVSDALWFVDVMVRARHMDTAEIDEWRRRIGAWRRFGGREDRRE